MDGDVGYLRESYHGEPYATKYLVAEAFEVEDGGGVPIAAATLRGRLSKTLELVRERARTVYKASGVYSAAVERSFVDFVELCEAKEAETGEPVTIVASY